MIDNNDINSTVAYMPSGIPVPEILTEDDLITLLRLDQDGPTSRYAKMHPTMPVRKSMFDQLIQ